MKKMALLFLMFLLQKIFLCFTWTLIPILLRTRGVSLGTIGMTALIYSPWALKFTYATWIDRIYSPVLGRRKTWIVPLLILFVLLQWMLSMADPQSGLPLVLAAIFILNLVSATMDIAMDGYATDILLPGERPWGNMIQTVGYMVGYMLGAGVFLICYQRLGWQSTVRIMVVCQIIMMLPVLLHKEMVPVFPEALTQPGPAYHRPSVRACISRAQVRWFILFSLIAILMDQGAAQSRLPMLVDKGYDPASLGRVMLWYGSAASVLGAVAGAALYYRAGASRHFMVVCLGAGALCLYSALIFQLPVPDPMMVGFLVGGEKFISGAMGVMLFSIIMTLSTGPQSATDNAVLNSLVHMFILAMAPLAGALCDITGFFRLYLGLGLASPLMYLSGYFLLRHCRKAPRQS
ncbi:MFS transporter [Desulfobacter curvatus]|uniref:MFS transporter n=1 Tax=Desulfobacter curvatus TaxID=2290 RepID=UPI00036EC6C6|nr:MFS transporter [Desulfobacter curvatus]